MIVTYRIFIDQPIQDLRDEINSALDSEHYDTSGRIEIDDERGIIDLTWERRS